MNDFPQPQRIGVTIRWNPRDLAAWEQARDIKCPPLTGGMLSVKQVAARYGVSASTIWRWRDISRKARQSAAGGSSK